jgi:hypothetical protein
MALRSVLDELKDAYRRDNHREPTEAALLAYLPPQAQNAPTFDAGLSRAYSEAFNAFRSAYDDLARPSKDPPSLDGLHQAAEDFWKYLLTVRDAMSLFTLLRWWRRDSEVYDKRGAKKEGYSVVRREIQEVAYLLIAERLLLVALDKYAGNQQTRSFTPQEWTFIKAPLRGAWYRSTYDQLLSDAFRTDRFRKGVELFLRLHALGVRADAALARNEEIREVVRGLIGSDPTQLQQRSFSVSEGRPRQTSFKIGDTVANHVFIVYFDAKSSEVYVNFPHTGAALYSVRKEKFARYADQAEYQLIYEATQGMLPLIGLLFQVAAALPGIVAEGFAGLVEACLMPVEQKAAEEIMDALKLDGTQAGWVVLGINLLARGGPALVRGETAEPPAFSRGFEEPGQAGISGRALDSPATDTPAMSPRLTVASGEDVTHPAQVESQPARSGGPSAATTSNRATGVPANDNRLVEPSLAELESHAATAEEAQQVAVEIAQLEQQLAEEESEELAAQAVASGGGKGRGRLQPARGTSAANRNVEVRGTGGPARTGGSGPARAQAGRTVLDAAKCARKGITKKMKEWIEDIAAEWRAQSARLRREGGSASLQGRRAHRATQLAIKKKHPGTIVEELTGVSSSERSRMSDLEQGPHAGAVAELKPWAWRMPDGRLATSREAIASGVETLQIQAYEIVDRGIGRPVFVFTAKGEVWTPDPGSASGWMLIGSAK